MSGYRNQYDVFPRSFFQESFFNNGNNINNLNTRQKGACNIDCGSSGKNRDIELPYLLDH